MFKLDHINIHVVDGPRMVRFFADVIGAEEGFRPPFEFPGHWIYVDGAPAIHLSIVAREYDYPQGMINHIAFGVYDYETIKARLATYHEQTEPLVDFYKQRGKRVVIDGTGDVDKTTEAIFQVLEAYP